MIRKSVVLSALHPLTESDPGTFQRCCHEICARGAETVEFYCCEEMAPFAERVSREDHLEGVFLLAGKQKKNHSWLCDADNTRRGEAVDFARRLLETGCRAGCRRFLLTSGGIPEDENLQESYDALYESLRVLSSCVDAGMMLTVEPGDRTVDARQLIGPTDEAVRFVEMCREESLPIGLTMDSSHCLQLGENVRTAFMKALPVTDHFHIANCILDEKDALYGDKHVDFDYPGGELKLLDAKEILDLVSGFSGTKQLTVGIEIINRCSDDPDRGAETILKNNMWFFS